MFNKVVVQNKLNQKAEKMKKIFDGDYPDWKWEVINIEDNEIIISWEYKNDYLDSDEYFKIKKDDEDYFITYDGDRLITLQKDFDSAVDDLVYDAMNRY